MSGCQQSDSLGGPHETQRTHQFQGTVTRITEGQAMAEVSVKIGHLEFIAAITEGSVKNMGLKVNDAVTVAVKATEVMIGK
jgi:molybdopterin-binding protein